MRDSMRWQRRTTGWHLQVASLASTSHLTSIRLRGGSAGQPLHHSRIRPRIHLQGTSSATILPILSMGIWAVMTSTAQSSFLPKPRISIQNITRWILTCRAKENPRTPRWAWKWVWSPSRPGKIWWNNRRLWQESTLQASTHQIKATKSSISLIRSSPCKASKTSLRRQERS